MYDSWRDQFLSFLGQAFETKKLDQREVYPDRLIGRVSGIIAVLTIAFSRSDVEGWFYSGPLALRLLRAMMIY
jgi:hypothetical protein